MRDGKTPTEHVEACLVSGGLLAKSIEGYEQRDGQIALAKTIAESITSGGNLIAEAPCGIGKSVAYLLPIILNMRKAVIATANIALQEQLVNKDIPDLKEAIGARSLNYILLKGKSNYVCIHKAEKFFATPSFEEDIMAVNDWYGSTITGDKSELPIPFKLWGAISSTNDECLGSKCKHRKRCFTTIARRGLKEADIIVTNYHMLLLAELEYNTLVCDEAHELPDIARSVLGWSLRRFSAKGIIDWLSRRGKKQESLANSIETHMKDFFSAAVDYLGKKDRIKIRGERWYDSETLIAKLVKASSVISKSVAEIKKSLADTGFDSENVGELKDIQTDISKGLKHDLAIAEKLETATVNLASRIKAATGEVDQNWVYWMEYIDRKNNTIAFEARPLDVSQMLSSLYMTASVHLSATMTAQNSFSMFRRETGAPESAREVIIPSPFNHAALAALVIPVTMPYPPKGNQDPEPWYDASANHLEALIKYCGGKTLALFNAKRAMAEVGDRLIDRGHLVVCQGDFASNKDVIEELRAGRCKAVLGVASFWTGVDIQGPALSGLYINRLPFSPPDDPLEKALEEMIEGQGGNPFRDRSIPRATLKLRQGVGRLIRRSTDTGVIMIADKRLMFARWCRPILASLPPYRQHGGLDKLEQWLRGYM